MKIYEIKVGGNAPATAHGLYHRQGDTPTDAKRSLARYFHGQNWGRRFNVKVIMSWMKASRILR